MHRGEILLLMSVQGQELPLGANAERVRFIPISGPYLKLIDWPKGANSRQIYRKGAGSKSKLGCTAS